jgi:hypothetical protein
MDENKIENDTKPKCVRNWLSNKLMRHKVKPGGTNSIRDIKNKNVFFFFLEIHELIETQIC